MKMSRAAQFKRTLRRAVRRNKFDLSHEKRLTADMFMLTPVLLDDCIPGDVWRIGNEIIIRMNPLVAPFMHEVNCYVHYYFVPYRLLWQDWEKFMTGGQDGKYTAELPRQTNGNRTESSLWDYFGFNVLSGSQTIAKNPLVFPRRAYNFIYNNFYRDPNIMPEVDLDWTNDPTKDLHVRCWEKDYFTSMLPWQQRGTAPSIDIQLLNANAKAIFNQRMIQYGDINGAYYSFGLDGGNGVPFRLVPTGIPNNMSQNDINAANNTITNALNNNTINLSDVSTVGFDVKDIRMAFAVQRFLERNARGGARYVEFLKNQYNAFPRDDRLQRPEYIGGTKTPIIISEVLQTSSSDASTPQGNMAGHGLSADRTYAASYKVQEHGLIMGIMSIMPRTMYSQGIDRVWLKDSKYDFYFDVFANLSEQAVYVEELYNYGPSPIDRVIGYQGRYDEYRYKRNTVHGKFRTDFEYWHLGRKFANHPTLNADLVRANDQERYDMKRIMAVPSEPMFLITFGNRCHVTRGMPYIAEPGLIDHN